MAVWLPPFLHQLGDWFTNPSVYMYGRWNAPAGANEGGVDLGSSGGTPVYALADGPIIGAGNFWHSPDVYAPGSGPPGYGVVTQRVNVPGYGQQDLYYQHIDMAPGIQTCYSNQCGQMLHKGDLIGTVHPGVNEVEMGFNANWGGVWGVNHPGPWATDPRPMLAALLGAGPPAQLGTQVLAGFTSTGGLLDFTWLTGSAFWQWVSDPMRLFKLTTGMMLIGVAILLMVSPEAVSTAKKVAPFLV